MALSRLLTSRGVVPSALVVALPALSYFALGVAGLLLARPPYFIPIFVPAAGVALALMMMGGYRMAFGVWLGASAFYLWFITQLQVQFSAKLLVAAGLCGLGAVLEAVAGLYLVRRAVGREPKLQKVRETLAILFWGGPVACVLKTSVVNLLLVQVGRLPPEAALQQWLLIWACDTLGVLVMLPITLAACNWPERAWAGRRHGVLWPLVAGLACTMALFAYLARYEQLRPRNEMRLQAERSARSIQDHVKGALHSVLATGRFLKSVDRGRPELFHDFVEGERRQLPGLSMVAWAPRVTAAQGGSSFPLTLVEPAALGPQLLGLELLSEPLRRAAVLSALEEDALVLTPLLSLPEASGEEPVILAILPVHEASRTPAGVAVAALQPQRLLEQSVEPEDKVVLVFSLWDLTDPQVPQRLCGTASLSPLSPEALLRQPLEVGTRRWELRVSPVPTNATHFSQWQLWGLLVSCLLFTAMLAVLLIQQGGEKARVAEQVAERTEQLHQRELFLGAVLSSALDGLLTLDAEGLLRGANPAACRLLGFTGEEWVGLPVAQVLPGLDWAQLRAGLEPLSSSSPGLRRDTLALRRDGTQVPVELALSNASTGTRGHYVCLLHDVSERAQVLRRKDEFVSTVSHELRTPLTSILGALSLINRGGLGLGTDVAPQLLIIAETNAQRLLHLINDLLDVDKLEAGELGLECTRADVSRLVASALEENRGYAERFQVSLRPLPGAGPEAWARVDTARFGQVMNNLISNAIKFSPTAGVVELGVEVTQDWVEVSVRDSGAGIPAEFQPLVFRKFSQADSSDTRRQRGTGLGLYITRMLVERMGGVVRFETAPNQGTAFFVRLPRVQAPAALEPAPWINS